MTTKEPVIVCAALRHKVQNTLIICGARHFDQVMRRQIEECAYRGWENADQGFIDQWGKFLTREEAHAVATKADQIVFRVGGDEGKLFSENLY